MRFTSLQLMPAALDGQTETVEALLRHGFDIELLKRTMSRSKDVKSQTVLESGRLKSVC